MRQCTNEKYNNIIGSIDWFWFAKALKRLKGLLSIHTESTCISWDMLIDENDMNEDIDKDCDDRWKDDDHEACPPWCLPLRIPTESTDSSFLRNNGMRQRGPPIAWVWPPA